MKRYTMNWKLVGSAEDFQNTSETGKKSDAHDSKGSTRFTSWLKNEEMTSL